MSFLQPDVSPTPIEGEELNIFIQSGLVSLTGLPGNLVIPNYQDEPPNIPQAATAWCGFGYGDSVADKFPYQDVTGQLQEHEIFDIKVDFFDLGTNGQASTLAKLLRSNLKIKSNIEWLYAQSMNLVSVGSLQPLPVIFKTRWQYRVRLTFRVRRNIVRQYDIPSVESAQFTMYTNSGLKFVVIVEN